MGITATVYGPLAAWSSPDGTVRVAVLVWWPGGKQPDGSIAPARWEAVNAGVVDPATVFPDTTPKPCGEDGCTLGRGHGGEWHDNGSACWPVNIVRAD